MFTTKEPSPTTAAVWRPPTSSRWVEQPDPVFSTMACTRTKATLIRVSTQIDTRLLLEDLYAKLALLAESS